MRRAARVRALVRCRKPVPSRAGLYLRSRRRSDARRNRPSPARRCRTRSAWREWPRNHSQPPYLHAPGATVDRNLRGNDEMNIFVFGSSITSSYWNGAATYYRGIYSNLARLGHRVTFAEPDAYGRQQKRDPGDYSYVESFVYSTPGDLSEMYSRAAGADLIIKHSGVGADDPELEFAVARGIQTDALRAFWDVDAPATLARVENDPSDPFRELIPEYDFIFTYGGGPPVVEHYLKLGARNCHPIYNALEPESHYPVPKDAAFACDLLLIAHRLPDRERRVEQFFLRAAELAPDMSFIL